MECFHVMRPRRSRPRGSQLLTRPEALRTTLCYRSEMIALLLAVLMSVAPACAGVKTGIEVLEAEQFAPLRGKHIAIITNHTGITHDYRRTVDLLAHAPGVTVVAIFSPEHGISGKLDQPDVPSGKDEATGIPIYSLHNGGVYRPSAAMMQGVDALVYDIQDVGARF